MSGRSLSMLALIVSTTLLCTVAAAHALAPVGLSVHERAVGDVLVSYKRALVQARGANMTPSFPLGCRVQRQHDERTDDAVITHYELACADALAGSEWGVRGLAGGAIDAVVRVELADGSVHRALLSEATPSWRVPHAVSRGQVVLDYVRLGVGHLLSGFDHLLFVLGLMWLIRERRRLIVALTAFTVGHSITLTSVTLGWVTVPTRLAEMAIAVSLMVLASAIMMRRERQPSLRWLWPMCAAFGLLHGLGFAGALADTGLPSNEVPLALGSFNLGIEIGQLAVVLVAALIARWLRGRLPTSDGLRQQLPGYALGSIAAMWCIERALGL